MRKIISNNSIFSKLASLGAHVFIVAGISAMPGCSVSYPLAGLIDASPTASLVPVAAPDKLPTEAVTVDMMPTASISSGAKQGDATQKPSRFISNNLAPGLAATAISPLALHLQPADLGSARSALNLALDSQSPLQSVAWSNPVTGSSGAFMPVGQESAGQERAGQESSGQDLVCRNFKALLHPANSVSDTKLSGAACKDNSGQWIVKSMDLSKQTS